MMSSGLTAFSQNQPADINELFNEMDQKIAEMMEQFDGDFLNGILPMDSLLILPFEQMEGDFHLHRLNSENLGEVYSELMEMMQLQMKSLSEQDLDSFNEFFKNFEHLSPNSRKDMAPQPEPQPSRKKKTRKSVDL